MSGENSQSRSLRTVADWLDLLENGASAGGAGRRHFIELLRAAQGMDAFDPGRPVVLVRSPGRYREFGNHTDYRACCGVLCGAACEEAVYGLFQGREDGKVLLRNLNPIFADKALLLSEMPVGQSFINKWNHWDRWTTEHYQQCENKEQDYSPYAWDKYIRGLLILLSELSRSTSDNPRAAVPGFSALYHADLTHRGGKSSSSALVVCTALGVDGLFQLDKPGANAWIDLLGMSEWYAMTRGGCADHAQIIYSRKDHFTLVGSFPTTLESQVPIPQGFVRVMVHCGVDRPKDEATLNRLRVGGAGYALAMLYIKQLFPGLREALETQDTFYGIGCLRELTSISHLEDPVPLLFLYDSILRSLPAAVRRPRTFAELPDAHEFLESLYSNHQEPEEGYPIRDIAVFGLAETERAVAYMQACRKGDIDEMLRLARISHDGDRVTRSSREGDKWTSQAYRWDLSDQRLDTLVALLRENPNAPEAQLRYLPGSFARSIPEMDLLADIVHHHLADDAALQVMGAGLGGEMHAIVREEKLDNFVAVIRKEFFHQFTGIKEPSITVMKGAFEGAGILEA